MAAGASEIPLATRRARLLTLGRSRLALEDMRREILRGYPGAVL